MFMYLCLRKYIKNVYILVLKNLPSVSDGPVCQLKGKHGHQ